MDNRTKFHDREHPEMNSLRGYFMMFYPREGSNLVHSQEFAQKFLNQNEYQKPQFVWNGEEWVDPTREVE